MFLLREHRNQIEGHPRDATIPCRRRCARRFDDPNLIADAGLVPVLALADQIGLPDLVGDHVAITGAANSAEANPAAKVLSLLAGMIAGADSITDMDRLRHAGNSVVFDQMHGPFDCGQLPTSVHPRACAATQRGTAHGVDRAVMVTANVHPAGISPRGHTPRRGRPCPVRDRRNRGRRPSPARLWVSTLGHCFELADEFLFFVSTLITGWPASRCSRTCSLR